MNLVDAFLRDIDSRWVSGGGPKMDGVGEPLSRGVLPQPPRHHLGGHSVEGRTAGARRGDGVSAAPTATVTSRVPSTSLV